jgi:hypothetical protein
MYCGNGEKYNDHYRHLGCDVMYTCTRRHILFILTAKTTSTLTKTDTKCSSVREFQPDTSATSRQVGLQFMPHSAQTGFE